MAKDLSNDSAGTSASNWAKTPDGRKTFRAGSSGIGHTGKLTGGTAFGTSRSLKWGRHCILCLFSLWPSFVGNDY
ncbi:hypothetical protein B0H17DRAFT_1106723 [Mycena rosella]|uniref:Uncharacterized protein n=1 Tax=Mycena rosella TaxID=1033263 RepID=A0AAD7C2T7_MYCRO|nr:hypothetical protein B0H17DRAFT_1106723 [Mycena rosella]